MQQINLYVPELRPKKEWLTAFSLSLLVLGFCFLMAVSVGINVWQLKRYEQQVVRLEDQRVVSAQQIEQIKKRSPLASVNALDAEIKTLRQRVSQRVRISELIGRQNLGNREGYAPRMNDLANTVPDTISISRFRFSSGAQKVELEGESKSSEYIAELVSNLQARSGFAQATFGSLTAATSDNANGRTRFSFGFEPIFKVQELAAESAQ